MAEEKLSIATMQDGGVVRKADYEIQRCLDNMLDKNTPAKEKRKVTLTLTFEQTENRDSFTIQAVAKACLASDKPGVSMARLGKLASGGAHAIEYPMPTQTNLDFNAGENVKPMKKSS